MNKSYINSYKLAKSISKFQVFTIIFLITILISGCTKYQYVWLQSDLPIQSEQEFVNENDTLRIVYRYNGIDCPVKIDIYNKLAIPVFVDLNQSAIIIDDEILPLWNGNNQIIGQIDGSAIDWTETYSGFSGDFKGIIIRDPAIRFIAPQARITVTGLHLTNQFLTGVPNIEPLKVKLTTTTGIANGMKHSFEKENSPMYFRSFITYSAKPNFVEPQYAENEFWVSEIIETMASPTALTTHPSNRYHVREATEFGAAATVITGVVLLVGIIALSEDETTEEY